MVLDEISARSGTRTYPGGDAVIFGATAARVGLDVELIGQLGDDDSAAQIRDVLKLHGVGLASVVARSGLETKRVRISVDRYGEDRRLGDEPLHFPYLHAVQPEELPACDHLFVAGVNSLLREAPDLLQPVVKEYRARGASVSFGLNRLRSSEQELVESIIDVEDLIFCSRLEFAVLAGLASASERDCAVGLAHGRWRNCVVTLGPDGVIARRDPLGRVRGKQPPLVPANTIGAGDCLAAVLTASLLQGEPFLDSLCTAMRAAQLSVLGENWDTWLRAGRITDQLSETSMIAVEELSDEE